MTSVGMRGQTHQDKARKMGTLSPISPLKTSLICFSGEATRQVSVSVLCFHVTLFNYLPQYVSVCLFTRVTLIQAMLTCTTTGGCVTKDERGGSDSEM